MKVGKMRLFLLVLLLAIFGSLGMFFLGPRQRVNWGKAPNPASLIVSAEQVDHYLEESEKKYSDIKANQQKRVRWYGAEGVKTKTAIVYIHGFSASSEEIRPVPDRVADAFEANVYFARMSGHGRADEALGEVDVNEWISDLKEAITIGKTIGDEVVIMATSNGAMVASTLIGQEEYAKYVKAFVFVSPNYRIKNPAANLASLAFFDIWGPWIAGRWRIVEPLNPQHAEYWTIRYPLKSIVPMVRLLDYSREIDFSESKIPALFIYVSDDEVSDHRKTKKIIEQWGAYTEIFHPEMTTKDDPSSHVLAGDIFSPNQTEKVINRTIQFLKLLDAK